MKTIQVRICGVQTEMPESGHDWIIALSRCHPHTVTDGGILHCHRYGESRHEWWCMCTNCAGVRETYRLHDVHRRDLGLPVGYPEGEHQWWCMCQACCDARHRGRTKNPHAET